jgi:hypothetical protein
MSSLRPLVGPLDRGERGQVDDAEVRVGRRLGEQDAGLARGDRAGDPGDVAGLDDGVLDPVTCEEGPAMNWRVRR